MLKAVNHTYIAGDRWIEPYLYCCPFWSLCPRKITSHWVTATTVFRTIQTLHHFKSCTK